MPGLTNFSPNIYFFLRIYIYIYIYIYIFFFFFNFIELVFWVTVKKTYKDIRLQ